jgi:hypothetical protein
MPTSPGNGRADCAGWERKLVKLIGAFFLVGAACAALSAAVAPATALVAAGLARTGWRLVMRPDDPWKWFS